MKPLTILLFTGNIAFNAAANLLMKIGMRRAVEFDLTTFSGLVKGFLLNWVLIGGVFAYVVSLGFYLFAIKDAKLSIAYPLSVSCAIVLVTVLSSLLLKESISVTQFVGGVVTLVGIFIMTR
jgi:multidrug transporter EmrE-like cation transporter